MSNEIKTIIVDEPSHNNITDTFDAFDAFDAVPKLFDFEYDYGDAVAGIPGKCYFCGKTSNIVTVWYVDDKNYSRPTCEDHWRQISVHAKN